MLHQIGRYFLTRRGTTRRHLVRSCALCARVCDEEEKFFGFFLGFLSLSSDGRKESFVVGVSCIIKQFRKTFERTAPSDGDGDGDGDGDDKAGNVA